jgi:hypothetical protein
MVCFGLLFAFALMEISLRLFHPFPRYPDLVIPDEKIGYHLKPNTIGRSSDRMGEYDTEIQTNHEGFRDRDHSLEKLAQTYRIAFLGDSFTLANQVEEQESFVRLVESSLNKTLPSQHFHQTVECMNFGIGGFDTQQEVLCYEEYIRKYHPDMLVLMMYPHNDLIGNIFYRYEKNFGRPYFQLENGGLKKIEAEIKVLNENYEKSLEREKLKWYHHIQIYNAQKNLLYAIRQNQREKKEAAQNPIDLNTPENIDHFWKPFGFRKYRYYASNPNDSWLTEIDTITRLLLTRLQSELNVDRVKFCVAMLPAEENLYPEKWPQMVKEWPGLETVQLDFGKPFSKIEEFLPELSRTRDLLDLRPFLKKRSATGSIFFRYDFHYNAYGQEGVAQALCDWLEPKLLDKNVSP